VEEQVERRWLVGILEKLERVRRREVQSLRCEEAEEGGRKGRG